MEIIELKVFYEKKNQIFDVEKRQFSSATDVCHKMDGNCLMDDVCNFWRFLPPSK